MKIEELIKETDPITLIEFKNYLIDNMVSICNKKDAAAMIIENNNKETKFCQMCGCIYSKNGRRKDGTQKYICSNCGHTVSETTGTVTCYSKLPFEIWKNIIDNLLNGFSIRRIAIENGISVTTSFHMRHKILSSLNTYVEEITLKNYVEADEKYFLINLKGTKKDKMPRESKKRGTHNGETIGISKEKVCVISAIDDMDNLILRIGGLGRGTTYMLENCLSSKVKKVNELVSDGASAYQKFCKDHLIELHDIPSGYYTDESFRNLAEINNVHSQLEMWLSKFRGVSIRHLQEYLDWFVFTFTMKKRFELQKLRVESYKKVIVNNTYIKASEVSSKPIPVNLEVAFS